MEPRWTSGFSGNRHNTLPAYIGETFPRKRRPWHLLYLRGQNAHAKGSLDGFKKALKLCEDSLAIDPRYARAFECLASAYTNLAGQHGVPQESGYELARGAAQKAIQHDPNSAYAYQTLGYLDLYRAGDLEASLRSYERALEISPGSSGPKGGMSLLLASIGRYDEAIELAEAVAKLDPLDSIAQANLAAAYFWGGRWEDALERYTLVKTLSPSYFAIQYRIAECLLTLDRPEEA